MRRSRPAVRSEQICVLHKSSSVSPHSAAAPGPDPGIESRSNGEENRNSSGGGSREVGGPQPSTSSGCLSYSISGAALRCHPGS